MGLPSPQTIAVVLVVALVILAIGVYWYRKKNESMCGSCPAVKCSSNYSDCNLFQVGMGALEETSI